MICTTKGTAEFQQSHIIGSVIFFCWECAAYLQQFGVHTLGEFEIIIIISVIIVTIIVSFWFLMYCTFTKFDYELAEGTIHSGLIGDVICHVLLVYPF